MNTEQTEAISEVDAALLALNERQQQFVQLIVAGVPQTEAAKRAGYAHKHAASMASHLRREPKVERALKALADAKQETEDENGIDLVEKRLLEISSTGTPSAKVSALGALQRLYETQAKVHESQSVLERIRGMDSKQRDSEIIARFSAVLDRISEDTGRSERVRDQALSICFKLGTLYGIDIQDDSDAE